MLSFSGSAHGEGSRQRRRQRLRAGLLALGGFEGEAMMSDARAHSL